VGPSRPLPFLPPRLPCLRPNRSTPPRARRPLHTAPAAAAARTPGSSPFHRRRPLSSQCRDYSYLARLHPRGSHPRFTRIPSIPSNPRQRTARDSSSSPAHPEAVVPPVRVSSVVGASRSGGHPLSLRLQRNAATGDAVRQRALASTSPPPSPSHQPNRRLLSRAGPPWRPCPRPTPPHPRDRAAQPPATHSTPSNPLRDAVTRPVAAAVDNSFSAVVFQSTSLPPPSTTPKPMHPPSPSSPGAAGTLLIVETEGLCRSPSPAKRIALADKTDRPDSRTSTSRSSRYHASTPLPLLHPLPRYVGDKW
jgi:hypothetical protein